MPREPDILIPLRVTVPLAQYLAVKGAALAEGVPLAVLVRRLLEAGLQKESRNEQ